jgi:hypothetical protein
MKRISSFIITDGKRYRRGRKRVATIPAQDTGMLGPRFPLMHGTGGDHADIGSLVVGFLDDDVFVAASLRSLRSFTINQNTVVDIVHLPFVLSFDLK